MRGPDRVMNLTHEPADTILDSIPKTLYLNTREH